jgi:hypothetical protein
LLVHNLAQVLGDNTNNDNNKDNDNDNDNDSDKPNDEVKFLRILPRLDKHSRDIEKISSVSISSTKCHLSNFITLIVRFNQPPICSFNHQIALLFPQTRFIESSYHRFIMEKENLLSEEICGIEYRSVIEVGVL